MAAIIACASPEQAPKKFKAKSVAGRKVTLSAERGMEGLAGELIVLPAVRSVQRGGGRFAKHSSASFHQRVVIGGRGAGQLGAVVCVGHVGAQSVEAQAPSVRHASPSRRQQAPSPVESGGEGLVNPSEERPLGGAPNLAVPSDFNQHSVVQLDEKPLGGVRKMVAPSTFIEDTVVISSEEEGDEQGCQASVYCGGCIPAGFYISKEGRVIPWVPRVGKCLPGCDNHHVLGRHGDYTAHQWLGWLADGKSLPVRVGAPFGHWLEGRVKPGAVHLTSREAAGHGVLGQDTCPGFGVRPSTSRGAGSNLEHIEEELLDYDEEEEAHEVAMQTSGMVETPKVIKKAVQCGRPVGRQQELVVGNLPRGEDYRLDPIGLGGSRVGSLMQRKVLTRKCAVCRALIMGSEVLMLPFR
ncbi:hypothetical protein NDU88_005762 [Pleurodeles waltl]|uniref:Uncharacterized protein n=1 Tax=Pleurodeles waltl TaxID=8319 RepID=A0AAV7QI28_PLEWA|nr:hypothetical protein NDU88_005762 [Pleurodeles waltl]